MSDFFTEPVWQPGGSVALPLPLQVPGPRVRGRIAYNSGTYNQTPALGARTALWDYTAIPWNSQVGGQTIVGPLAAADATPVQKGLADQQARLATAESALAAAQTAQTHANEALASTQAVAQAAQDAFDAASMLLTDATVDVAVATRRQDPAQIAAAQTEQANAFARTTAAGGPLSDALTAQGAAADAASQARTVVLAAQADLETIQDVAIPRAQLDLALFDGSPLAANATRAQYFRRDGGDSAASDGYNEIGQVDAHACVLSVVYNVTFSTGQYQIVIPVPDDVYQALQSQDCTVTVLWSEVTSVLGKVAVHHPGYDGPLESDGTVSYTCPPWDFWNPAPDPSVTFTPMSAALSLGDAVFDVGTNTWNLFTPLATLTPGDPGDPGLGKPPPTTTITVEGPPNLPGTSAEIQRLGAQRFRQGFQEYTTAESAATARRYLTLTASGGVGTPSGVIYGGTVRFEVPPADWVAGTYVQTPTDYFDGGDYSPPSLPFVVHHTLSADAAAAYAQLARSLVTDGNQSLTPTVRTSSTIPGLVLTLSDEQTPGDIQSAVATAVGADWPAYDPAIDGYPPIPFIDAPGAINCVPATGDYCGQQKMRYKLTHGAGETRVSPDNTFETTHHWELHRRNLLTGAVSIEAHEATLSWPNVQTQTAADGTSTTVYLYTKEDDDWTEMAVPAENESVTLVLRPGENPAPQTFGQITATIVAGSPPSSR